MVIGRPAPLRRLGPGLSTGPCTETGSVDEPHRNVTPDRLPGDVGQQPPRAWAGGDRRYPMTIRIPERLLTPGQVARMFTVDRQTVTRWATTGRLGSIRTPGGHHRFRESEVNELLADVARRGSTSRPGDPRRAPRRTP